MFEPLRGKAKLKLEMQGIWITCRGKPQAVSRDSPWKRPLWTAASKIGARLPKSFGDDIIPLYAPTVRTGPTWLNVSYAGFWSHPSFLCHHSPTPFLFAMGMFTLCHSWKYVTCVLNFSIGPHSWVCFEKTLDLKFSANS
jgi:hypothetical protein